MKFIKTKAIFEIILIISVVFSVYLISAKSVEASDYGCCEKIGNKFCEPGYQENCDQSNGYLFVPGTSCASTDVCKTGTCFIDGQCFANFPRSKCTSLNGVWYDKTIDKVSECSLGCCITGTNCNLVTQEKCNSLTPSGLQVNFLSNINNEQKCIFQCVKEDKGCCIYGADKLYKYITRDQCSNLEGDFKLNTYCSAVPDSTCKPNDHVGCIDNSYDLYSFDSCENNEGVKKNCDYPNGRCEKDVSDQNNNGNKDEFICRNLNCENTYDNPLLTNDGSTKKNGEAWCEYPSATGPGLDLPGSIHYKHYCIDGVEYAEACGNNRNEYCSYGKFTDMNNLGEDNFLSGLPDMSVAQCRENKADDCSQQMSNNTCMNSEERTCIWTNGKCLPLVKPGFTKQEIEDGTAAETCSAGSTVVKVLWQGKKQEDGSWKWACVGNCQAFDGNTLKGTNFLCMSQGDCGATPNIAGEFTSGGYWRNCFSGMVSGKGNKPKCISQITEGLWKSYYNNLISTPGTGLFSGGISVKDYKVGEAGTSAALSGTALYLVSTATITATGTLAGIPIAAILGSMVIPGLQIITAVILVVSSIILILSLGEKQKVKKLSIACSPYVIPKGGDDCWKCSAPISKGGLLPDKNGNIIQGYNCQPYTCETLGTACKFLPDSADGPICVKGECRSVLPPIIKPDLDIINSGNSNCCTSSSDQFECNSADCGITDKGTNVGYEINGNVNELKTFTFGIRTFDETGTPLYTKCSYSDELINPITEEGTLIDVMSQMDSLSDGLASTKHNITIPAGYFASTNEKEFNYYIRCKSAVDDSCDSTASPTDYVVKFKVHTGPDTTAPLIEYIEPTSGLVANNQDTKSVTLRLNEVITYNEVLDKTGGCKWSTENLDYDSMTNEMLCSEPGINEQQECSVDIANIAQGENKYYFSCSDSAGNKMSPVQYSLTRTDALNVSMSVVSDACVGTPINCYTNNITIKTETSGGAESGKSKCYLSSNCEGCKDIPFFKTDSNVHEQVLDSLYNSGLYRYYTTCEDIAGNIGASNIEFSVSVDSEAPKLISVSKDKQYNKLKIILDDANNVNCEYSNKEFSKGQGSKMDNIGNSFFAPWGPGLYYIRCEDKFGNEMPVSIIHTSDIK